MRERSVAALAFISLIMLSFQNCTGFVDYNELESSSSSPFAGAQLKTCSQYPEEPAPSPNRRLTKREISNSLRQVFGDGIADEISIAVAQIPREDTSERFDTVQDLVSQNHIDALFAVGESLAEQLMGDNANFMGAATCAASFPDTACAQNFIETLGKRLFRRPLNSEQINRYLTFYTDFATANTAEEAIANLASVMVQSPSFYYLQENNGTEVSPGVFQLDNYELASRIAIAFTGSVPDDDLLAAADSGELSNPGVKEAHARRLLLSEAGRSHMNNFFNQQFHLSEIPSLSYGDYFLNGLSLDGLGDQMTREALDFVNYNVFDINGTFNDLMTSQVSFVRDPELAAVYGVEPSTRPDGQMSFTDPKRSGIMTRAALLVSAGEDTNAFHRGNIVYSDFLCGTVARPDPDAIPEAFVPPPKGSELSRHTLEGQTSKPDCIACHRNLNPMGFAFEEFDTLGRFRTTEKHFNPDGSLMSEFPIESATQPTLDGVERNVSGVADLGAEFGESAQARICFSKKWIRFSMGRYENYLADNCAVTNMAIQMNDPEIGLRGMFLRILESPHFLVRKMPTE